MLGTSLPMNWSQISEEIPSSLVIMSHREWDSGEDGREKKGGESQTSVTLFMGSNKTQVLTHKKQFMQRWESYNLGKAKENLDIWITKNHKKQIITLDQIHYVAKVVK